mmetsp:Transcript_45173/g.50631  ORF Transcript_45173/g.50631 Transcript_45173/m.50631 type:complete len:570 (+) Transcript_45173:72-1781(+)
MIESQHQNQSKCVVDVDVEVNFSSRPEERIYHRRRGQPQQSVLSTFTMGMIFIFAAGLFLTVQATTTTTTTTNQTPANNNNDNNSSSTLRISKNKLSELIYEQQQQKNNKNMNTKLPSPIMISEEDLPIDNQQDKWQSLNKNIEFIPADGIPSGVVKRFLEQEEYSETESYGGTSGMEDIYDVEPFAYGVDEYDEYQQAWRLMGFIVDCNPMIDDDYYANGGSGSGDQGTGEGCARYVLWAAYVDLDYEGGGIGEYQFYDTDEGEWDTSACEYSGNERCAKMDCHLENTHFSLLGFFKHKSYDDWMEQLFKHEGICVWSDEEYAFMSSVREAWPQGCIDSYITTEDGTSEIYYDIKPVQGGDIEIGLYTDTECIKEYQSTGSSDPISVENILGNFFLNNDGSGDNDDYYDFSADTLEESMSRWTSSFGKFCVCQPCVAYDLENYDGTKFSDDDGGNGGGDMFDCYDDADYTNVNQCMKFMAKTTMNTATFRDMSLGRYQGTLVATQMNGIGSTKHWTREAWSSRLTYLFLVAALGVFIYGAVYFYKAKVATNYNPTFGWTNFKEPLVMT